MVADNVDQARRALGQGRQVVLVVPPGADPVPADLWEAGHLAVMVGDPGDPCVVEAARLMDGELAASPDPPASRRSRR